MCHLVWDVGKGLGQLQQGTGWSQGQPGSNLCVMGRGDTSSGWDVPPWQGLPGSSCTVRGKEGTAEAAKGAHPHHPLRLGTDCPPPSPAPSLGKRWHG